MWTKEVLVFPKPARLGTANLLLTHSSPYTIAECLGLGIKFYSVFSDGTLLMSSSYRSSFAPPPNSRVIKNPHSQSVEEAWAIHRQKVTGLRAQGLTVRNLASFSDYVEIEKTKLAMAVEA